MWEWEDEKAPRLFARVNYVGGNNIAKLGGRRARHRNGVTTNGPRTTTAAKESAGQRLKMRGSPQRIVHLTAS
jgi:hypothetical protein